MTDTVTPDDTLRDKLLNPEVRPGFLAESKRLLDDEVSRKGGLAGMTVKGAYSAVKAIRPGFVEGVLDVLLDEWVAELEPEYAAWRAAGSQGTLSAHILARRDAVAERLLHVTDRRAASTRHTTAKKLYDRLRGSAKSQVADALPRVGALVDRYVS
ncbi:MAG: hypothetical protein H6744_16645 [Deltaproteobacteria bacterium]|nr:hypothetical protein [Deltaproteobacteria bacterium]MCB9788310.1 hypothetical protein [Deltaproteobacteria bacterium]